MIRTFLRGINVSLLLLIITSTFYSCANELNVFEENNNKQINFSVSVPSWKSNDSTAANPAKTETRATPITDTFLGTDNTFGIIADVVNGSNYNTEIDKEVVSYNTTNKIWETVANHYWPGANKTVNIYAYYPASITNGTITHTAGTTPTLTYTVPTDATTQADIMTSTSIGISGTTYSSTSISFKHILAAVKFNVGTNGMPSGTIKSISITGVKTSGTYTFDNGWVLGPSSTDVISSPSITITGTPGASITSGTYTFLMIPQIFTNAIITVTYSNRGVISKTISGTWTAGNIYTYNISKIIPVANFGYTGNVQSYTVPLTGTYKIECWGAQGGLTLGAQWAGKSGYGGYSYGNLAITQNSQLYICIGDSLGYNGGRPPVSLNAYNPGGGATHISTTNRGELANYKNYQSEILIVAGGGGSAEWNGAIGGAGGGLVGGNSNYNVNFYNNGTYQLEMATGGTQTTGGKTASTTMEGIKVDGSFGQGGYGYSGTDAGGIGGGGWYGGGGSVYVGGAGGGSGHLGSNLISGTTGMQNGIRPGNGYARITFISAN